MIVSLTEALDLGLEGSDTIRLWEIGGAKGHFISLFYCWGTAIFIKTIVSINKHKQGISIKQPPKTFKIAFSVVVRSECNILGWTRSAQGRATLTVLVRSENAFSLPIFTDTRC